MSRLIPFIALVALVASGCGQSGSHATLDTGSGGRTLPTGPSIPGPSVPAGPAGPAAGNAAQLVQGFQAAWANVKTLSGHYDSWEKNAGEIETNKVEFWFQKPGNYRLEVSDATEALKRGSKSVFSTRTRKISSRPGGALSFVKLDGTLDDARSKSVRGYTLDQTDYQTQTNLLLANPAALKLVPNRPNTLELANPSKFPGVDALRATLDPQKLVPIYFELSEHGQLCATRKFTRLNVNPAISSDKFTL
jgi:outer membrane lipoprotein-sorting protein